MTETELPEKRRQQIFAALVVMQDDGTAVRTSRAVIASRYSIRDKQVLEIEREGVAKGWLNR